MVLCVRSSNNLSTNYPIKIACLITFNSQNRNVLSITAYWHKQVLQAIRIAGNDGYPRKKKHNIIKKLVRICLESDTHRVSRQQMFFCENKWSTYRYISHTNDEVENRNTYRQQTTMNTLTEHLRK